MRFYGGTSKLFNDVSEKILGSIFLQLAVLHRNPGPAEAHGNTGHLCSSPYSRRIYGSNMATYSTLPEQAEPMRTLAVWTFDVQRATTPSKPIANAEARIAGKARKS